MNPLIKGCWRGLCFCAECAGSVVLWTLWLALLIVLGLQLTILGNREFAVPGFILREITARLTAQDLRAEFGRTRFDPSGRILVEDVRLSTTTIGEPLLTARTLYLKLDPWALILRDVELTEVRATGVDLIVPAMFSPAGRSEAVIRDLHASVRIDLETHRLHFDEVNARLANIELAGHGEVVMPAARPDHPPVIAELIRRHLQLSRRLIAHFPDLELLSAPRLSFELKPHEDHLAVVDLEFLADHLAIEAGRFDSPHSAVLARPRAHTSFPVLGPEDIPLTFDLRADRLDVESQGSLHHPQLRMEGSFARGLAAFHLERAALAASHLVARGIPVESFHVTARPGPLPVVHLELAARLDGEAWSASGDIDRPTLTGQVELEGALPYATFVRIATHTDERLTRLIVYQDAPEIRATIRLGPGGKPEAAEASFVTGPLTARNVSLDATRARVTWANGMIEGRDIELRTGPSLARGTYSMDPRTRDFRFFLSGRLQPAAINGWFRDWWPRFWSNFDFLGEPPGADVEVSGLWGRPWLTRVFVQAGSGPMTVRSVSFDRIQANLFIRPGHFDGLDFFAEQDGRTARGRFTYGRDLAARAFRSLDFDVLTDLPPGEAARIAGNPLARILAPFAFTEPPEVQARGRVTGAAAPEGAGAEVNLVVRSRGPMTFHEFPLSDLAFRAEVSGRSVRVDSLTAGFAGGVISGRGDVDDLGGNAQLGFDGNLVGAQLGESIRIMEAFSARRANLPPPPQSRFQQRIAAGRLHLDLSAEGPLRDTHAFNGSGNLQITGADLGEINLLGILSSLLRPTLLNHSTLQLDTARANFTVAGNRIVFPEVRLNGPRAAIDANGHYRLDTRTVDFMTRIHPFEESRSLLSAALDTVLTPISSVFEVRLTGSLSNPTWAFAYGPTSLLRAIIGESGSDREPPAANPAPAPSIDAENAGQ